MSGKSFEFVEPRDEIEEVKGREDWQIVDLEALLLKRGLIPEFVCGNDSLLFGNKEAWYPNYIDEVKSDAVKLGLKPNDPCVKREVKSDNNEPDD